MDGDAIINALWDVARSNGSTGARVTAQREMKSAMAEILRGEGYFVCETTAELRATAIDETDLVEPNAE